MLRSSLSEAVSGIAEIARFVRSLSRLRTDGLPYGLDFDDDLSAALPSSHVRLFEHTGAVIRVYSLFERLVIRLAEGWIQWCLKTTPSAILGNDQCRATYEYGLAEIFRRQTEIRFANIDKFDLSRAHSMFSADPPKAGTLRIDPYIATLPNFKIEHVLTLFSTVGLGNPTTWLNNASRLLALRDEHQINYSEALKNLVELRNEVAHGNPDPDETIGANELLARIELIAALGTALYDFTVAQAVRLESERSNVECLLGTVTHRWPAAGAFELTTSCRAINGGERVVVLSDGAIEFAKVESIQVEGIKHVGWTGVPGVALGLVMGMLPPVGSQIYRLDAVREEQVLLR